MQTINWEEYRKPAINWKEYNDPNFKPTIISGRNALGMKWVIIKEKNYDINIHIQSEGYTWHVFGTNVIPDKTIYKTVKECVENSPITVNHSKIKEIIKTIQ